MTYNKSFAVQLPTKAQDPSGYYKTGLMDRILNKYPWLTVAGVDAPFELASGRKLRGVEHASANDLITFGTARNHDVNWLASKTNPITGDYSGLDFIREKGVSPVLDIIKDWNAVTAKLDTFAASRKPNGAANGKMPAFNPYMIGNNVEVFDNFFKVGYVIIPRNIPTRTFYSYSSIQLVTITEIIITIKNLY